MRPPPQNALALSCMVLPVIKSPRRRQETEKKTSESKIVAAMIPAELYPFILESMQFWVGPMCDPESEKGIDIAHPRTPSQRIEKKISIWRSPGNNARTRRKNNIDVAGIAKAYPKVTTFDKIWQFGTRPTTSDLDKLSSDTA